MEVVGVRFRKTGKIYHFSPAGIALVPGDRVVAETAEGLELGTVVVAAAEALTGELSGDKAIKPVLRKATEEDIRRAAEFKGEKKQEAIDRCKELVVNRNLPMKILDVEYTLDGSRATFAFSAESRVDFRELVRDLGRTLKTRVHFRQVGPRDQAKIVGGIGPCGRDLCCAGFLREFEPVTIKMAKEQDLPLNPVKVSGSCGRLLCCLSYEYEAYRDLKSRLPKVGQKVTTPTGEGTVVIANIIKGTVVVELESRALTELPADQVQVVAGSQPAKRRREKRREAPRPSGNNNPPNSQPSQRPQRPPGGGRGRETPPVRPPAQSHQAQQPQISRALQVPRPSQPPAVSHAPGPLNAPNYQAPNPKP